MSPQSMTVATIGPHEGAFTFDTLAGCMIARMRPPDATTARGWERVASDWTDVKHRNPVLAHHKRQVYANLIKSWTSGTAPRRGLKTDLFAEAFNDEEFLSLLPWPHVFTGIDISTTVLRRARHRRDIGTLHGYVTCDVRSLPFRERTFDLVVSDSTLDHFRTEAEIHQSLEELARVLAPGGRLIVTIDNPAAWTYPPRWLVQLWMRLGLAPYYVGVTVPLNRLRSILEGLGLTVQHESAILHYPHPDGLVRLCESCVRRIFRARCDRLLERLFAACERFGGTRVRYRTGRYLAIGAIKEEPA